MIKAKIQPMIKGEDGFDDPHYLILKDDDLPALIIRFDDWGGAYDALFPLNFTDDVEVQDANS